MRKKVTWFFPREEASAGLSGEVLVEGGSPPLTYSHRVH